MSARRATAAAFAAGALLAGAALPLQAATLSRGSYLLRAAVLTASRGCPLAAGAEMPGELVFPGPGKPGAQFTLRYVADPGGKPAHDQATVLTATLGTVPAAGLAGWSAKVTFALGGATLAHPAGSVAITTASATSAWSLTGGMTVAIDLPTPCTMTLDFAGIVSGVH